MKKIFFVAFFWPLSLFATTPSLLPQENQMVRYIAANQTEQIALLEKLVNINSGTDNLVGVQKVGDILQAELAALGFKTRWAAEPASMHRAATLIAEHKGTSGKRILLIGHLDTVFPQTSSFQKFVRHGNSVQGPGVIDDKGGDVVMLYALKALHAAHALDNATITVVLTGDEENSGKPTSISRKPLIDAAKASDIALDFEATKHNAASIGRRGGSHWLLEAQGKAGHSARIFSKDSGDGAIFEMARILNEMRVTLSTEKYLTFNPGAIVGGTDASYDKVSGRGNSFGKNNVISQIALASGDVRYLTPQQRDQAEGKITAIVSQHLPETSATIQFSEFHPSMPPTENNLKLFERYSEINQRLGYGAVEQVPPESRGGGDICFIASHVAAGLVGIGANGKGEHSEQETLELDSLVKRSQSAALLIYQLTH